MFSSFFVFTKVLLDGVYAEKIKGYKLGLAHIWVIKFHQIGQKRISPLVVPSNTKAPNSTKTMLETSTLIGKCYHIHKATPI